MQDHRVRLHRAQQPGVDGITGERGAVRHPFWADARLVDHVDVAGDRRDVVAHVVPDIVFVEVRQNVGAHLHLGRAHEVDLDPRELAQEVGQGPRGPAAVEFADDRDRQAVEGPPLAVDRVEVHQGLRRMLAAAAVAGVDDRHAGDACRPARPALFGGAQHDDVAERRDDANRVFQLLALDLRRELPRLLGGQHAAAEPVHGRLEREARARGRFVEERRHDPAGVVAGAAARDEALHLPGAVEQRHQERDGELLRLYDMLELHGRPSLAHDVCAGVSPNRVEQAFVGGDDHFLPAVPQEPERRLDLGSHVAGGKVPGGVVRPEVAGRDPIERSLAGLPVVQADAFRIGRNDEERRVQVRCQQGRRPVLVDDGLDAAQGASHAHHRNATAARGNDEDAALREAANDVLLDDLQRLGRRHDAPETPGGILDDVPAELLMPERGFARRVERADGLGGPRHRRILRRHHHLRQDGGNRGVQPGVGERSTQ